MIHGREPEATSDEERVPRRQILRASLGGLGLCLGLFPGRAHAYTAVEVGAAGRVSGLIRLNGRAPKPARVALSGDCAFCRKFDLRTEDLLVSGAGGLRNVVVSLDGIQKGKPLPAAMPTLAEKRCTFVPHVLGLCAGSRLLLHNQDPVLNTFHAIAVPSGRTLFNIGMPNLDQKIARRIRQPGLVKMLCDVHPWEVAYLAVFDHPYHAVTDDDGRFEIGGVPAGTHVLTIWHEKLGTKKQTVRVAAEGHARVEITYP